MGWVLMRDEAERVMRASRKPGYVDIEREWGTIDAWCEQVVIYAIRDIAELYEVALATDLRCETPTLDFAQVFDRVMDRPQVHILFRRASEAQQEQMVQRAFDRVTAGGIAALLV